MPSREFTVDASGQVQAWANYYHDAILVPDRDALDALALHTVVELPEEPRILLLNSEESPHIKDEAVVLAIGREQTYLPTWEHEDDLVVKLPLTADFTEQGITESIAQALANRKREEQNRRAARIAFGLIAVGLAGAGVGRGAFHSETAAYMGFALFAIGTVILAYYSNRGQAPTPNIEGMAPPVRLADKLPPRRLAT